MEIKLVVTVYFVVVIIIGIVSWFKIKTPADYYIASKRAGIFQVSGSLLATILGGSAVMGTIELSQKIGWAAFWLLFSAAIGLLFLVPLSKYINRYGNYTLPELLGRFYGKKTEILTSVIIPLAWIGVIAAQIITAAKILIALNILSYQEGAILSGVVFTVYTLLGGQLSILKTDTFQAFLIIAGISILTVFIFNEPPDIFSDKNNVGHIFNSSFTPLDLLILVLTYSVTFVVGPDIYSRIFCAKNEQTASKSVFIVALILIPLSFMLTYIGIYSGNSIISFTESLLPGWMYGVFLAALLSAVMSSADTTLLNSSIILSGLVSGNLNKISSLKLTRLFIVLLGFISIIISIFVNSIIDALLFALTLFSGAFTIPTLFGLLNIPTKKHNITCAVILGGILALLGKITNTYINDLAGNIIIICSFVISFVLLLRVKTR
ncbi:MAG: sodium:solute symporter family protein [Bacteroidales bacterium]|jgi:SSS family solute:Na+ symporter|nr:sodium:solute symporter family protein [Bacteroidales bacterium]